jgi:hypothetical protein
MLDLDRVRSSLAHGHELQLEEIVLQPGQRLDASTLDPGRTYRLDLDPIAYRRAGRPQDLYSDITGRGFRLYTPGAKGRLECLAYPRMRKLTDTTTIIISREVLR